jgi:DNA repair exonuclease SbcCD ATPase subunit
MAKSPYISESGCNGSDAGQSSRPAAGEAARDREEALRAAGLELLKDDDPLREQMEQLAEENRHVRSELQDRLGQEEAPATVDDQERLRADNDQLREKVAELEHFVEELQKTAPAWAEKQKEYESLIEEKTEVIRQLHQRLHEQPQRPAGNTPREEELLALSEELERERHQLKDDEESLMEQMRQMEVQMSRERAELARQRNELQRLQNDVRHELELASRDATLRDRLAPLQRRHQDLMNRRGGQAGPAEAPAAAKPSASAPTAPPPKSDSSLFRRLFG